MNYYDSQQLNEGAIDRMRARKSAAGTWVKNLPNRFKGKVNRGRGKVARAFGGDDQSGKDIYQRGVQQRDRAKKDVNIAKSDRIMQIHIDKIDKALQDYTTDLVKLNLVTPDRAQDMLDDARDVILNMKKQAASFTGSSSPKGVPGQNTSYSKQEIDDVVTQVGSERGEILGTPSKPVNYKGTTYLYDRGKWKVQTANGDLKRLPKSLEGPLSSMLNKIANKDWQG